MNVELTDRQRVTLRFIERFIQKNGWPPTVREISTGIGNVSNQGTCQILDLLVKKGRIERMPRVSRGIRVVHE